MKTFMSTWNYENWTLDISLDFTKFNETNSWINPPIQINTMVNMKLYILLLWTQGNINNLGCQSAPWKKKCKMQDAKCKIL